MTSPDAPTPPRGRRGWPALFALAGLFAAVPAVGCEAAAVPVAAPAAEKEQPAPARELAPELAGGVAWLNTAGPLSLHKDLKGKVVILDFWTLCCINCIHILPDLAKLEKKYPNELVVVGVHSPKFDSEKETKNIKQAVLRYEIAHPVVNDADRKIWDAYGAQSWPTFVVIDPEGKLVGMTAGEGNLDILDSVVKKLIDKHRANKTLDEKPIRFDLVRYREKGDTPLFFPGKVLADGPGNRLFIADSTHHRVVVTDLSGKKLAVIGGGTPGRKDGRFAEAQFDDPQGMALDGETLYIADRKNHSIRAADLKAQTVTTAAGTGEQAQETRLLDRPGPARATGLNSPWDLLLNGRTLFIAMAGHHQIWAMDVDKKVVGPFAGDGRENIKDGPLFAARFAQPSGLASDGTYLYVADSEVSAVRKLPLVGEGRVETLVGEGLFEFGDVDGVGKQARLQHALGVQVHDGKVVVADTYNNKLKLLDPKTKEVKTFLGGGKDALFDEPAGLSLANGKLYVADTNAHRIQVVDLASKKVSTLELTGVAPPPPQKEWLPPGKK